MKFSENWLRTFVNPPLSTSDLAQALTMAGLEVETVESVAPTFDGVVVAEVLSVKKHPDADHLNVCQVNVVQPRVVNHYKSSVAQLMFVPDKGAMRTRRCATY